MVRWPPLHPEHLPGQRRAEGVRVVLVEGDHRVARWTSAAVAAGGDDEAARRRRARGPGGRERSGCARRGRREVAVGVVGAEAEAGVEREPGCVVPADLEVRRAAPRSAAHSSSAAITTRREPAAPVLGGDPHVGDAGPVALAGHPALGDDHGVPTTDTKPTCAGPSSTAGVVGVGQRPRVVGEPAGGRPSPPPTPSARRPAAGGVRRGRPAPPEAQLQLGVGLTGAGGAPSRRPRTGRRSRSRRRPGPRPAGRARRRTRPPRGQRLGERHARGRRPPSRSWPGR